MNRINGICFGLGLLLLTITGCGRVILTADDVVYVPGQDSVFVAQLERDSIWRLRNAVEDQMITFSVGQRDVGMAKTDSEGRARLVAPITAITETDCVTVKTSLLHTFHGASRPIHRWDADRVIIVVDVDHTVCDTDFEELLLGETDVESTPLPGSVQTLRELAQDFHVLYMTARPRFLLEETRDWLAQQHFPHAPLVTARSVGDLANQADIKKEMLHWRRTVHPQILIGIGDKQSDAQAYDAANMLSIILLPSDLPSEDENLVAVPDWAALGAFFQKNAAVLQDESQLRELLEGGRGAELALPDPTLPTNSDDAMDATDAAE